MKINNAGNAFGFRIESETQFYKFLNKDLNFSKCKCEYCRMVVLSFKYLFLIFKLKKAGLLPEDHKNICCYCYNNKVWYKNENS